MKKYILMMCSFFIILTVSAQDKTGTITGTIQSSYQQPLPGITIQVTNTNFGTTTDSNGRFNLSNIPAGNYTLVFSGLAYKISKVEVVVKPAEVKSIVLELNENTRELKQVNIRENRMGNGVNPDVTSGTRTALSLTETPQSIQVISHSDIESQQAQTLTDLTKDMVGVIANNNFSSFTMRGFSTLESTLSNNFITVDGGLGNMYYWQQQLPLYNVDRVENIGGPDAALYSEGTPGGIINMVTKRPLDSAFYSFDITTGSWDMTELSADLTGPLTKDKKLRYRANLGFDHANSFRPYQYSRDIFISPSLSYVFNDKTSLSLDYVYDGYHSRAFEDPGAALLINSDGSYNWNGIDKSAIFYSPYDFGITNDNSFTLTFKHKFSDHVKIDFISRYTTSTLNTDQHGGTYYNGENYTAYPDSITRQYTKWKDHSYNIINSAFATIKTGNEKFGQTFLAGVDYQIIGSSDYYVQGAANSVSFYNPNYGMDAFSNYPDSSAFIEDNKQHTNQAAGYLQDLIGIGKHIKILLAERYENYNWIVRPNGADNYTQTNDSAKTHVFIPRAGIVYNFNNSQSVYVSYTESFTPQYDNARNNGGPFPPQIGQQWETGYKAVWFDGKLITTLAGYNILWKNILGPDPTDTTHQRMIAIPGVTSRGVEFTARGTLGQFYLTGSYAYNNMIFASNSPLGTPGQRYDNAPKHIADLYIGYAFTKNTALGGLSLLIGGKYVGNRIGNALLAPDYVMPAYFLLDGGINYHFSRFDFGLNGYNLTNRTYVTGWYASDFMAQVGTPVNWRLNLKYTIK